MCPQHMKSPLWGLLNHRRGAASRKMKRLISHYMAMGTRPRILFELLISDFEVSTVSSILTWGGVLIGPKITSRIILQSV